MQRLKFPATEKKKVKKERKKKVRNSSLWVSLWGITTFHKPRLENPQIKRIALVFLFVCQLMLPWRIPLQQKIALNFYLQKVSCWQKNVILFLQWETNLGQYPLNLCDWNIFVFCVSSCWPWLSISFLYNEDQRLRKLDLPKWLINHRLGWVKCMLPPSSFTILVVSTWGDIQE